MRDQEILGLMGAYASIYSNLSESHFKVGDEVICKNSGMEGEVVKVDSEEKGKYYTVKREDGKMVKYAPDELKLEDEKEDMKEAKNGGVSKKKEEKFHTKLDKLVHSTFGSSPEEEKMKEEFNRVEEGYKSPNKERIERQVGKAYKTERSALNRGDAEEAMRQNRRRNAMNSPSTRRNELESKNRKEEVEFDIFDVILEHLVAEGYADTNKAALAIMANMSEEWRESIMIDEGMTMKAFKENRKKARESATRADAVKRGHVGKEWYNSGRRYSPDEAKRMRSNLDDEERSTRHRSAVDPEGDDSNYSADKTKNSKKLRKQKAMGELG